MAYKQAHGRGNQAKTGHGMGPILQTIAGTKDFSEKNPNAFKANPLPEMGLKVPNIAKDQAANASLRANSDVMDVARYDLAVKSNSPSVKADLFASKAYGKGSANPADTSAETMTLKQNQGQLPGEKGFKGGTDRSGGAIFPGVKGNAALGEIPMENQGSGENYAGNKSKVYFKSDKPGNLGKLETLSTGHISGGGNSGTANTSQSVIGRSFGAADQFNQEMGGSMNKSKIGRDRTFGTSIGEDTRANTFKFATGVGNNKERQESIDRSVGYDLAGGQGTLAKQDIYNNAQGSQAIKNKDTNTLVSMAKSAGGRGEKALGYLQGSIEGNKPGNKNAGYESSYKQKYDYPTDETLDFKQGNKGTTYSGPKGGGYFSPESTFAQNKATATAADANVGLKDFLTKGKSYFTR